MSSNPLLARENLIKGIVWAINHLRLCVEDLGAVHLLDANTVSESFFAEILNELYDLHLINLNGATLNQPGIDIGDAAAGICFQVTSDGRKQKIKNTIKTCVDKNVHKTYHTLRFLIIGRRVGKYENIAHANTVKFDPTTGIVSTKDLARDVAAIQDFSKLTRLADKVDLEMPAIQPALQVTRQSDDIALAEYRAYFDRSALQDPWLSEGNFGRFGDAMDELIGLLNTGIAKGKAVTKRRSKFADNQTRTMLDSLYHKLRNLRQLFTIHVRNGEIDILNNRCNFTDPKTYDVFNTFKQIIVDELNSILTKHSLQPIQGVSGCNHP